MSSVMKKIDAFSEFCKKLVPIFLATILFVIVCNYGWQIIEYGYVYYPLPASVSADVDGSMYVYK